MSKRKNQDAAKLSAQKEMEMKEQGAEKKNVKMKSFSKQPASVNHRRGVINS